jgi:hypothetical protein
MLEIAGGIILAILILWVFAALARPIFKVLAYFIGLYVLIMAAGFLLWGLMAAYDYLTPIMGDFGVLIVAVVGVIALTVITRSALAEMRRRGWVKPKAEIQPSVETRVWVREPVIWIDPKEASVDKWKRLMNIAMNNPDVFGVKLDSEWDGRAAMDALYAVDRCRDISYVSTEGCIYAWKRRAGE